MLPILLLYYDKGNNITLVINLFNRANKTILTRSNALVRTWPSTTRRSMDFTFTNDKRRVRKVNGRKCTMCTLSLS